MDEEPMEFETLDDAIAEALEQVGPDGVVVIHAAECDIHDGDEESCSCEPLELKRGAAA